MKETLTLLERCQREHQDATYRVLSDLQIGKASLQDAFDVIDTLAANTLKQAAEALEGRKATIHPIDDAHIFYNKQMWNAALTDAQKMLTGEYNENV